MKKTLFIVVIFALLLTMNSFGQNRSTVNKYVNMMAKAKVTQSSLSGLGLPYIAGTWYYVDAHDGDDDYNGLTPDKAFATIPVAYAACTSGDGDGIALISRTISGTSYSFNLTTRLAWTKYGITMIGIASPNVYFGRARITHAAAYDSLVALLHVTGNNNTFINLHFSNNPENDGSPVSATAQVCAVQVGGARNTFISCHFFGNPQSATAYKSDLVLRIYSDECRFIDCFFGSSSYNAGNNAACWVFMETGAMAGQRFFSNCTFLQQVSAGTAFGGIKSGAGTSMNGIDIYEDCNFGIWRASTSTSGLSASFFIGTNTGSGCIMMRDCIVAGFTALDAAAGNDKIFTNQPAGNAAGGIGATP